MRALSFIWYFVGLVRRLCTTLFCLFFYTVLLRIVAVFSGIASCLPSLSPGLGLRHRFRPPPRPRPCSLIAHLVSQSLSPAVGRPHACYAVSRFGSQYVRTLYLHGQKSYSCCLRCRSSNDHDHVAIFLSSLRSFPSGFLFVDYPPSMIALSVY